MTETFANLCRSGYAWATGGEPFWVTEAREAAEEAHKEACEADACRESGGAATATSRRASRPPCAAPWRSPCTSVTSCCWVLPPRWCAGRSSHGACPRPRAAGCAARLHEADATSLVSVCRFTLACRFIFTCAWLCRVCIASASSRAIASLAPADGMLIYRLLGEDAEASFACSFGVSYGLSALQEARSMMCCGR